MHSKELCYSKEKAVNSHKCRHSSQFIPANIPESIQSSEQWAVVCELDRTIYTCSKRFELICKVCFGQSCVNTINKQSLRFIVNLLCMLWMVSILLIKMGASKQNLHFWCWRQNLHSNVPTDYRMLHASLMVLAYVRKKSLIQLFLRGRCNQWTKYLPLTITIKVQLCYIFSSWSVIKRFAYVEAQQMAPKSCCAFSNKAPPRWGTRSGASFGQPVFTPFLWAT